MKDLPIPENQATPPEREDVRYDLTKIAGGDVWKVTETVNGKATRYDTRPDKARAKALIAQWSKARSGKAEGPNQDLEGLSTSEQIRRLRLGPPVLAIKDVAVRLRLRYQYVRNVCLRANILDIPEPITSTGDPHCPDCHADLTQEGYCSNSDCPSLKPVA